MKTLFGIVFVWFGLVMGCVAQTVTNATEQTTNSIRVVLVTVSKANVVPALTKTNPPVAGTRLVYLVEAMGTETFRNGFLGKMRFVVDGKVVAISKKVDDETLIQALEYQKFDWKKLRKPTVTDPSRVIVYEATFPYYQLPKGKTDFHVEAGFNLKRTSFVFKDINVE